MVEIVLYTKADDGTGLCEFCIKAKDWLTERNIPFTENPLQKEERKKLYNSLGLYGFNATVPQILLQDGSEPVLYIGGYNELIKSGVESFFK